MTREELYQYTRDQATKKYAGKLCGPVVDDIASDTYYKLITRTDGENKIANDHYARRAVMLTLKELPRDEIRLKKHLENKEKWILDVSMDTGNRSYTDRDWETL